MKELWTFTTREKLDKFLAVLGRHGIDCEITSAEKSHFTIAVNEAEYVKAKRVLLKHRERRTSGDSIHSNDKNIR